MASTSGGGQHGSTTSTVPSSNTCFTFHLVSFLILHYKRYCAVGRLRFCVRTIMSSRSGSSTGERHSHYDVYLYIFCWHFSEQASTMPQAWEFGWYFKFLTFCGFAFQMVALMTSFISHLMPEVRMLKRTANDLSCAGFEIANAATLVYWTVIFWTSDPVKLGWRKAAHKTLHQGLVEGVPLWLSLVTNIGNAGVAWADLLVTERTFRRSSLCITILFMVVYGFWVYVCEARNEDFPHPFAKPLRQPDGSVIVSSLAFAFVLLFHKIGSWLASRGTSPLVRKIKLV